MIPKINKYDFYLYSDFRNRDNPHNLIHLIAHAKSYLESENLTKDEQAMFIKRKDVCVFVFEDEWDSRNGKVQFFLRCGEVKHLKSYYDRLIEYAGEFNFESEVPNIQKSLEFYIEHETEIKSLRENQDESDDNWWEKVEELEKKFTFDYSIVEILANQVRKNPNNFCRDKNGGLIDPNFTGKLKHYFKKGTIRYEYTVINGQIFGEFIKYDNDGNKSELSKRNGYSNRKSIKRWFHNGQIKYEKINDSDWRYWYKNGKVKMEKIGSIRKKWDEKGQEIK